MLKLRGYFKGVLVLLLCVFLVSALACVGPPGPAGPPGPPGPSPAATIIVLTPTTIKMPGVAVTVFGAGFAPEAFVSLRLAGTWKGPGIEEANPSIGSIVTNKFGAFKTSLPMPTTIAVFKITPGLYTILAVQDHRVVASAPLEITP